MCPCPLVTKPCMLSVTTILAQHLTKGAKPGLLSKYIYIYTAEIITWFSYLKTGTVTVGSFGHWSFYRKHNHF